MPWAQPMQVPRFAQPADVETHAPSAPTGSAPPSSLTAEGAAAAKAAAEDAAALHIAAAADYEKTKELGRRRGKKAADEAEAAEYRISGFSLGERRMMVTKWLWRPGNSSEIGSIPLGEITILAGRGGVGKSTVLATWAAWITRGEMYGEFHGTPRNVVYIPNEDDTDRTLKPRVVAAGGDPHRVKVPELTLPDGRKGKLTMPRDMRLLEAYAREHEAAAIMFDPMSSNLGVSNRNNGDEMRAVLEELRVMATRLNLAIIGNAHMRKASSSSAQDGVMGSIELVNVSRSMMAIMADEARDGVIILSHDKSNYSPPSHSYEYEIKQVEVQEADGEWIKTSAIRFLGKSDKNVSMMMADAAAGGMESKTAVQEAIDFVTDLLRGQGGQMLKQDILGAAQKERISARACQRAAEALKLRSLPSGQGAKRLWAMPEKE